MPSAVRKSAMAPRIPSDLANRLETALVCDASWVNGTAVLHSLRRSPRATSCRPANADSRMDQFVDVQVEVFPCGVSGMIAAVAAVAAGQSRTLATHDIVLPTRKVASARPHVDPPCYYKWGRSRRNPRSSKLTCHTPSCFH